MGECQTRKRKQMESTSEVGSICGQTYFKCLRKVFTDSATSQL